MVNPGDRLALAHLVYRLRPRKILEIGTHAGASTLSMALALEVLGDGAIETVDITDVNDPDERRIARLDPRSNPSQLLQASQVGSRVRFVVSDGLEYLKRAGDTYDMIFLDGDHSAETVYREIPAALNRLALNGVVLLHDYFPRGRPLWSDGRVEQGPWLAVQRLQAEGAEFHVRPLGALPWPTKLRSRVTSLALLTRCERPAR